MEMNARFKPSVKCFRYTQCRTEIVSIYYCDLSFTLVRPTSSCLLPFLAYSLFKRITSRISVSPPTYWTLLSTISMFSLHCVRWKH